MTDLPCHNLGSRPERRDMHREPIMDLAHLGHSELLTQRPDESLRFFVAVLGMTESGRKGVSVPAGLGRPRALSPQDLPAAVDRIKSGGAPAVARLMGELRLPSLFPGREYAHEVG